MMTTEDLIQRLASEVRPVQPLASPWRRATIWMAGAAAYVVAVALVSWVWRGTLRGVSSDAPYIVQQLALLLAAVSAAWSAFTSVVPGAVRHPLRMPLALLAIVMAAMLWGMGRDLVTAGMLGVGTEIDWPCVGSIVLGAAVMWSVAAVMLRRGAAVSPVISGVLAGLAAVSLANIEACLTRAHVFSATVFLWHGGTSLLVIAASAAAGSRLFVWAPQLRR